MSVVAMACHKKKINAPLMSSNQSDRRVFFCSYSTDVDWRGGYLVVSQNDLLVQIQKKEIYLKTLKNKNSVQLVD